MNLKSFARKARPPFLLGQIWQIMSILIHPVVCSLFHEVYHETKLSFTSEDHSGFFWDIFYLITFLNKDSKNVMPKCWLISVSEGRRMKINRDKKRSILMIQNQHRSIKILSKLRSASVFEMDQIRLAHSIRSLVSHEVSLSWLPIAALAQSA